MHTDTERLKKVLAEAVTLDTADARAAYLDNACGGDDALRSEVESLLALHEEVGDFLERPVLPPAEETVGEGPGTVIGPYTLLEEIGEGTFGRVFRAAQAEPVAREVALKIVKAGMDTREVIGRFEAERKALALMDHPHIARILDAGATDAGRPFFVMELVEGLPITAFCDQHRLPTKARLKLFTKVCQAVQHAHQKGLIHRDLKPSNILVSEVDGEAVPKIIDFGVAKALGGDLAARTLLTVPRQVIGTPAYMSPEQAASDGEEVDTRSDVYSLGVLLYELLTGVTPFDAETLHRAAIDELRRLIRETDPPRPSTRLRALGVELESVARQRHTEPAHLTRTLHGDLDWIAMRALEKDPERRYQTISALAEDIGHHLAHEPVDAGPPHALYRTRKFIRRHRVASVITATIAAAAVFCIAALGIGMVRIKQERDRAVAAEAETETAKEEAESQTAIAEAVNAFLREDLLRQASPYAQPDRELKLRTLVDRAAGKVEDRFNEQPEVEFQIRLTLSEVYLSLGELLKARNQMNEAKELCEELELPMDDPKRLRMREFDAEILQFEGKADEALKIIEEVYLVRQQLHGPEHYRALSSTYSLANAHARAGRFDDAREIYDKLVPVLQQVLGPEDPLTLNTRNNLANVLLEQGKPEEARKIYEEILPLQREGNGLKHPVTLMAQFNLGYSYQVQGQVEEARRKYEELLPLQEEALQLGHPETQRTLSSLATIHTELGQPDEALKIYGKILDAQRQTLGDKHPSTLKTRGRIAHAHNNLGQHDEALKILEEILPPIKDVFGQDDLITLIARQNLGFSYQQLGRLAEARRVYEQLLQDLDGVLAPAHPVALQTRKNLADVKKAMDEAEEEPNPVPNAP